MRYAVQVHPLCDVACIPTGISLNWAGVVTAAYKCTVSLYVLCRLTLVHYDIDVCTWADRPDSCTL